MKRSSSLLWGALALGAVAGMRSMLAPTMTSRALAKRPDANNADEPARTLAAQQTRYWLIPLAVGELVGDKLPFAPDRTISASMMVRAVSGGMTAAVLASARRQPILLPALAGATAACVSAKVGASLRSRYASFGPFTNAALGITEDCLALAIGSAGLQRALGEMSGSGREAHAYGV
jgi:uncharacterized membrane protein